jgi:hypothetical protein
MAVIQTEQQKLCRCKLWQQFFPQSLAESAGQLNAAAIAH